MVRSDARPVRSAAVRVIRVHLALASRASASSPRNSPESEAGTAQIPAAVTDTCVVKSAARGMGSDWDYGVLRSASDPAYGAGAFWGPECRTAARIGMTGRTRACRHRPHAAEGCFVNAEWACGLNGRGY